MVFLHPCVDGKAEILCTLMSRGLSRGHCVTLDACWTAIQMHEHEDVDLYVLVVQPGEACGSAVYWRHQCRSMLHEYECRH
jgi:hypothetical protein